MSKPSDMSAEDREVLLSLLVAAKELGEVDNMLGARRRSKSAPSHLSAFQTTAPSTRTSKETSKTDERSIITERGLEKEEKKE